MSYFIAHTSFSHIRIVLSYSNHSISNTNHSLISESFSHIRIIPIQIRIIPSFDCLKERAMFVEIFVNVRSSLRSAIRKVGGEDVQSS